MEIVIFTTSFLPAEAHGGVPFSTFYLARALVKRGHHVHVLSSDRNLAGRLSLKTDCWIEYRGIPVAYCRSIAGPYIYCPKLSELALTVVGHADIVISSGTLWNHAGMVAHKLSVRFGIAHVVYLRGLLDPWALKFKPMRKIVFWFLQGRQIISKASAVLALCESEKESVLRKHRDARVHVIPNGIDQGELVDVFSRDELVARYPDLNGSEYLLFLGRVCEQKGISLLLPAFKEVAMGNPTFKLLLCGPILQGYERRFYKLIAYYNLENKVIYGSVVSGALKNTVLKEALGLVLPSFSEGLPLSVLEAMAVGLPVVVSKECHMPEVEKSNAGWVVDTAVSSLQNALEALLADRRQAVKRGLNGKALTLEKFSWDSVAQRSESLFLQLTCKGN